MDEFKKMIPFAFTIAVAYYLLPLLGNSTGSFMLILLVVLPLICLTVSFVYGIKNGWNLFFPIAIGVLFIPAIFIYFNSTAWVYFFGFSIISAVGIFIGKTIKNR